MQYILYQKLFTKYVSNKDDEKINKNMSKQRVACKYFT